MPDNHDPKVKDMEPKKDAKGGKGGGAHPGIPHSNPTLQQGKNPPSQSQGHGGPKIGN